MNTDRSFLICLLLSCTLVVACSPQQPNLNDTIVPPLISAAEMGDAQRIAALLEETQASVDVRDDCHWTPLMKASLYGHVIAADQLMSAGANLDLIDKGGYSALMLAASNNHVALVKHLLEQGANPNMQESSKGWTALIWAAKRGHKETVDILIQGGAATEIRDFEGETARGWAITNRHIEIANTLENRQKDA